MTADIITIGDELLIGQVVNTNAAWIAQKLNLYGFKVNRMITVPDSKQEILNAFDESKERSNIVIITGGLGPTSDDITKPVMCEYFNTSLRLDEEVYKHVEAIIKSVGGIMNELNKSQAKVPAACKVLFNSIGTAPGMWFEKDNTIFVSLPGVPFEMEKLMTEQVLPELKSRFNIANIFHRTIITQGIGESMLAERIAGWEKKLHNEVKIAYLPSPGIVKIRLSVYGNSDGKKLIADEEAKLITIISDYIFGFDNDTPESVLGKILTEKRKTVSTAESCTGGNISRLITSVSGSSEYYIGSIVAYSNELKIKDLNVEAKDIEQYGAVSQQVVEAMALGAIKKFNTDFSIAVSGVAGPTGGTVEKPVGTVWIAVASKSKVVSNKFSFGTDRDRVVSRASITALNMMRKLVLATH
jgi:nicotinamide-nucleotide amidase